MSKAHQVILSEEADYQRLWQILKWVREQPQLYTVFVRASAMRDQYQNRHWWAMMRNLQWASGGQYTSLQWHAWMAVHVLGIDIKDVKGRKRALPWSTQQLDPEEFQQACLLVDAEARLMFRDYGVGPNEVAL